MEKKAVQFSVEVNNLVITSGTYEVLGIVHGYVGAAAYRSSFQGNTFTVNLLEGESEYFAVTVFPQTYTVNGVPFTIQGKPVNMLATFYLPEVNYVVKVCPESSPA